MGGGGGGFRWTVSIVEGKVMHKAINERLNWRDLVLPIPF